MGNSVLPTGWMGGGSGGIPTGWIGRTGTGAAGWERLRARAANEPSLRERLARLVNPKAPPVPYRDATADANAERDKQRRLAMRANGFTGTIRAPLATPYSGEPKSLLGS